MTLSEELSVNAIAVCDCKNKTFHVGLNVANGENRICVIECSECGYQLAVPYTANIEWNIMTDTLHTKQETTVKLLPCPFCGGTAHTTQKSSVEYGIRHRVECLRRISTCPMDMRTKNYLSEKEAIAAWNTRN